MGKLEHLNIDSLHHAGIVIDPDNGEETNRPNEKMRPKLLRFSSSNNVSLLNTTWWIQMKNVTFQLKDDEFRPAIIFDDVKGINITKIKLPENLMSNQLILKDFNDFKIDPQNENLVRIIE
jgi:hypothetical protein